MKVSSWRIVLVGCLILGLWGCVDADGGAVVSDPNVQPSINSPVGSPMVQTPASSVDPILVSANTKFGLKLLAQLLKEGGDRNLMISPSSVAIALSMTYNGANGETQKAIAQTLELQGMSLDAANQANLALSDSLKKADPKVKLAIANSLWGKQGFAFKPDFLERNQQFYQAEVANLDFSSPAAATRINDWVKANTEGKIPSIVQEIDPNQVLFLVNAVYFKGNWTKPFDRKLTIDRPFTLLDGGSKSVPMMAQQGSYLYAETDEFQAIGLPYGSGRLSMYVFLPKASLTDFTANLTAENWSDWTERFSKRRGSIQLPRFKFEYGVNLTEPLKAIGMADAFDPAKADFSGISAERTVISQVQHKTFIEVNEEGTEAAASTSVGIATLSAPTEPPFQMVVDRPFFAAIRDNQTGTVLFMGRVVEP
jgi:serine protease inhibitor